VVAPAIFPVVINLKVAQPIGRTIPESFFLRTNEVIGNRMIDR
jgi:hypothetical protein